LLECVGELRKVGEQEGDLRFGLSSLGAAEEDHGRILHRAKREQRSEIGIGRNDNALLRNGEFEDRFVVSRLQTEITHVDRVVALVA
jgi:hypothetical protein